MKFSNLRLFLILFNFIVNTGSSFSQRLDANVHDPNEKNGSRMTFKGGVLYKIEDISQGLKDMWRASGYMKEGVYKENLALFTSQGLLVLPNEENNSDGTLGSLRFLSPLINQEHTKVTFAGDELEILGMVHTHPNLYGVSEHAPYNKTRFEWKWTTGKIGNYVLATDGVYQAQPDYLTSKRIGFKRDKTYQLIINRYYSHDSNKYFSSRIYRKNKSPKP